MSMTVGRTVMVVTMGLALGGESVLADNQNSQTAPNQKGTEGAQANPDDQLKQRIQGQIKKQGAFRDVDVDVKEGTATLKGKVASDAEKARAERMARVDGILHVDNQIEVDPSMAQKGQGDGQDGDRKAAADDTAMAAKLKTKLLADSALKNSDINVEVDRQGTATLTGTVPSETAHARALEIARAAKGVHSVNDQIKVEPKK